jgi:hypothetical protein
VRSQQSTNCVCLYGAHEVDTQQHRILSSERATKRHEHMQHRQATRTSSPLPPSTRVHVVPSSFDPTLPGQSILPCTGWKQADMHYDGVVEQLQETYASVLMALIAVALAVWYSRRGADLGKKEPQGAASVNLQVIVKGGGGAGGLGEKRDAPGRGAPGGGGRGKRCYHTTHYRLTPTANKRFLCRAAPTSGIRSHKFSYMLVFTWRRRPPHASDALFFLQPPFSKAEETGKAGSFHKLVIDDDRTAILEMCKQDPEWVHQRGPVGEVRPATPSPTPSSRPLSPSSIVAVWIWGGGLCTTHTRQHGG